MSTVGAKITKKSRGQKSKDLSFFERFFNGDSAFMTLMVVISLLPLAAGGFFGTPWSGNPDIAPRIFILSFGVALVTIMYSGSLFKHQIPARLSVVFWLFAGFLALVFLSTLTGISPYAGFFGGVDNSLGFLTYVCLAALFVLTTQLVTGQKRLTLLSKVIVYSSTIVALVAWIQRIFGWSPVSGNSLNDFAAEAYLLTRGYGTLGNPDFLGHALLLPALLSLALFSLSDTVKLKRIFGSCFFIIAGALIGTSTRGAIIALLVAGTFFIVMSALKNYPYRSALILLVGTLIVAVLIAIPISARSQDHFLNRFIPGLVEIKSASPSSLVSADGASHDDSTFGGRLGMWSILLESIKENPLLGAGPANTLNTWRLHRTAESLVVGGSAIMTDAHNFILELLVTVGIPATLLAVTLFIWILGLAIKTDLNATKLEANSSKPAGRILHLAWTSSLIAFMVSLLTAMATITWLALLFLNLAVSLSPHMKAIDLSYPLKRQRDFISIATVAGLFIAAVVGGYGSLFFVSNLVGGSAISAADPLSRLELASKIAPFDLVQKDQLARHYQSFAQNTQLNTEQRVGALSRSIEIDNEVMDRAPRTFEPYYGLAISYYMRAEIGGDSVDFTRGHEIGKQGLKLYPAALSLRTSMAMAFNGAGRYQEAYDVLQGWTGYDLNNTQAEEMFNLAKENLNPQ